MPKKKYYVVWQGRSPGIYDTWPAAKGQVDGYANPHYQGYATLAEAQEAYANEPPRRLHAAARTQIETPAPTQRPLTNALAVDAACAGNPGPMEYRGVSLWDNQVVFQHQHKLGTNNIGEFLAIVEALARLRQAGDDATTVYSDSQTAIGWVRRGKCNTKLLATPRTADLLDLVARAERWLASNTYSNPLVKWPTEAWGEIPADYGRK